MSHLLYIFYDEESTYTRDILGNLYSRVIASKSYDIYRLYYANQIRQVRLAKY